MSTKLYFCSNAVQHWLHTGPLAEHVDSFASWLFDQGYSREMARTKLRLTGVLSRWLEERALDLSALDELLYGVFLAESDAKRLSSEATGRQLLGWLRTAASGMAYLSFDRGGDIMRTVAELAKRGSEPVRGRASPPA